MTAASTMACAVAGLTADANTLIDYVRHQAQKHLLTYNQDMPCEQLVQNLCDLKQGYTQYGGKIFPPLFPPFRLNHSTCL